MKLFSRLTICLFVMLMSVSLIYVQDAPSGTFNGTWDYTPLPDHHLNAFAAGGPSDNLGEIYQQMVEMPFAYYIWAEDRYEPLLASTWRFDGVEAYEVTINEDATWSNGDPITVDDVIATFAIERVLNHPVFNYISDVQKVNNQTARFVFQDEPSLVAQRLILKEPIHSRAIYGRLAERAIDVFESDVTPESDEWQALIAEIEAFRPDELLASGPYTYTLDDVNDTNLTLRWHPNSIFSDAVKFDEIVLWQGNATTTEAMLLDETIWHSSYIYSTRSQQIFRNAGLRLISTPRGYGTALLFNDNKAPWAQKETRQATALVIDRNQNAFLTNGFGAQPSRFMSGLTDDMSRVWLTQAALGALDRYEYSPDRAVDLMQSAGFTQTASGGWEDIVGFSIQAELLIPQDMLVFVAAGDDLVEQLTAFGFEIEPVYKPWREVVTDIKNGDFDLAVWQWSSGSPFPVQSFAVPLQQLNRPGLVNSGQPGIGFEMQFEQDGQQVNLDTMINRVNVGLDLEEQRDRASAVALIINDELPYLPLTTLIGSEPFNDRFVTGAPPPASPLYTNPPSDHFLIRLILNGILAPVE